MNVLIKKTLDDYRNVIRLQQWEARRDAFIEKYSKYPDPDYAAYYGLPMASWIDAVQTWDVVKNDHMEWWEYQEQDDKWLQEQEIDFIKRQAF